MKCGWYIATATSSAVNSYVKRLPGSTSGWVRGATPSNLFSTLMPCRWMSLPSGQLVMKRIRLGRRPPNDRRPGNYAVVGPRVHVLPGATSHWVMRSGDVEHLDAMSCHFGRLELEVADAFGLRRERRHASTIAWSSRRSPCRRARAPAGVVAPPAVTCSSDSMPDSR